MAFNLSDYVTGAENIQPSDFTGPDDGTYEFELTDIYVKEGSQNHPDAKWIFVEYQLESGTKYNELFALPKDPERPTENEHKTLQRYLGRLQSLGVPRNEVNTVKTDTLIGRTGSLTLRTTTNRQSGREYQNISKLVVNDPTSYAMPGFGAGNPADSIPSVRNTPPTSAVNPFSGQ